MNKNYLTFNNDNNSKIEYYIIRIIKLDFLQ